MACPALLWGILLVGAVTVLGAERGTPFSGPVQSPDQLKALSLDELFDQRITSVSKRPEELSSAASAIQVITAEDIHRSGATRLPEALRLASNLSVAQVDSQRWAISARGFNSLTANKLLVMIDGRTVYTPLFSGVFWDVQDTFLEDIDRIEVISGPGATLWGANAVNGVVNILTKSARETQGTLITGGGGNELQGFGGVRYGATVRSNLHARVYGKGFQRDATRLADGRSGGDGWHMSQGGFRMDWTPQSRDEVTVQGDYYSGGIERPDPGDIALEGGNLLTRWSRQLAGDDSVRLQAYYDRTRRVIPGTYGEVLNTYDLEWQHDVRAAERHQVLWGLSYRLLHNEVGNTPSLAFLPPKVDRQRFGAFVQDRITLVPDSLQLTVGTKLEHNNYTDWEFQPSGRLSWRPSSGQTVWGAVSRAVRTPSRIDRDLFVPGSGPPYAIQGGPTFGSESLVAYELGYRVRPRSDLTLSVALFVHDYDDVRSVEQLAPPAPVPQELANGLAGETYGVEWLSQYQATDWWRLSLGYTHLQVDLDAKPGSNDFSGETHEANDSRHHVSLASQMDFGDRWRLDGRLRYVSAIRAQQVPSYTELDVRLAWHITPDWVASIVGQSLLHRDHAEFGTPGNRFQIERSIYGKLEWHF